MHAPSTRIFATAVIFLLAGVVKGTIGLGLPTISMGLLSLFMPPARAAALLLVPSLVTNIWQLLGGRNLRLLLRRLGGMMAGICVGSWAGTGIIAGGNIPLATVVMGTALVLYAAAGLTKTRLRVPPHREAWAGPAIGAATGLMTGATGVFVIPAVPYLSALALERDELMQALGLSFTVSTLALASGLAVHEVLTPASMGASLLALAPSLVGMALGGWLRRWLPPEAFRLCFFLGLFALGGHLIWRGLT